MKPPRRIAVLHDSPDFGGHERAFLNWLPALLASPGVADLHLQLPEANAAFLKALAPFAEPRLRVSPSPYVKLSGEPYRAPLRASYGRQAAAFVERGGADLVLMLQGRIENLATPMLWLPRGLEMVSYLPMAHNGADMGRPAALAAVTDAVKRIYYARPQRFVVPSNAVAAQARRAGARGPIHVVENVPTPASTSGMTREAARRALGLDPGAKLALFMGRFDAHQKGLDHLLRDLRRDKDRLAGWRFLFVGQGPAEPAIRAALEAGLPGEIVGWTADPDAYLAVSDLLLVPSRFEGVPLVMLEALQRGLPVLGSDIDVYREYLPAFALRDFTRPVDLAAAVEDLAAPDRVQAYRRHAAAICDRLDLKTSQARFVQAVLGEPDTRSETLAPTRRLERELAAP